MTIHERNDDHAKCHFAELTDKERAFVEAYLGPASFNATEAARIVGYSDPNAHGSAIRRRPHVAALIEARFSEMAMGANEVLGRLSEDASFNISDFVDIGPRGALKFNLAKAKKAGKLHLLMSVEYSKTGKPIYKFVDRQAALTTLARHHGLLKDKLDITANDALVELRAFLTGGKDNGDASQP